MQILREIVGAVDDLLDLRDGVRLPSVAELRPTRCLICGQAAYVGGGLRIVGHGVYLRQVLGVGERGFEVPVRRYLCRGCERTTSVLPDLLHPRYWYAAGVILEALRLHLVDGLARNAVRAWLRLPVDAGAIWCS
jgi:hypothetical protein